MTVSNILLECRGGTETNKKASTSEPSSATRKPQDVDEDGTKKRKQKTKKDLNAAPKRARHSFSFFCEQESELVSQRMKKRNPWISFVEVGEELLDRWNKMTDEEREPFKALAKADKKRYEKAMADYKNTLAIIDSGNESGNK